MKLLIIVGMMLSLTTLRAQRIITDTIVYYSYGQFCEDVRVCKLILPDSTYKRINGKVPDRVFTEFKYESNCFPVAFVGDKLYTYSDFHLMLGVKKIEISFPSYTFGVSRKYFLENIKGISLFENESDETIPIENIQLVLPNYNVINIDLHNSDSIDIEELSKRLKGIANVRLKVPRFIYPVEEIKGCGRANLEFPEIIVRLLGV